MKRIAFIATNDGVPWGGSEELWSQAAIQMVEQGFSVAVSIKGWKPDPKQVQKLEQSNCTVVRRWDEQKCQNFFQRQTAKIIRKLIPRSTSNVFDFLNTCKYDLVVISQGFCYDGLGWMEACLEKNIPYVIICQAASESVWPYATGEYRDRYIRAFCGAIQFFFVSKANIKLLEKQIGCNLSNSTVVRNTFNVSYDATPAWPKDDGVFKLACVGRLEPWCKGQDLIFEVLCSDKWKRRPIKVTLFGEGLGKPNLLSLKDMWNLENVELGGFVTDIEAIWAHHHGLVLPSRHEGLPLAVVEAMLCNRFCIVTDVAGNTEVVEDNVNGFVAMAPKAECLNEAMERAWQKREYWREIGQTAAASIRKLVPRDPAATFVDELKQLLR